MGYSKKDIGSRCPECGGIVTDLNTLPTGSMFLVANKVQVGKVIESRGKKFVRTDKSVTRLKRGKRYLFALSDVHMAKEYTQQCEIDVQSCGDKYTIIFDATLEEGMTKEERLKALEGQCVTFLGKHILAQKDSCGIVITQNGKFLVRI